MFDTKVKKKLKVLFPDHLQNEKYVGLIYGYYKKNSGIFNVISSEKKDKTRLLGEIVTTLPEEHAKASKLWGVLSDAGVSFYYKGVKYETEFYSLYLNIFSRNKGILETSVMREKSAVILGCGSVGSLVALELARSGVGNFLDRKSVV